MLNRFKRSQRTANRANAPRFRAELRSDGVLELMIFGDIVDASTISSLESWGYSTDGLTCALGVKSAMDAAPGCNKIRLRINSPGGDAFEGMAIHSLLVACGKPVEAHIDGIAASSASIIAMAAGTRVMGRTAMMMIHNAWGYCCGNKADMTKTASTLDAVDGCIAAAYVHRTGKTLDEIKALMDAETWMGAQACVDQGFATQVTPLAAADESVAMKSAARFQSLARLRNVPDSLKAFAPKADDMDDSEACACACEACQAGDCQDCSNADCDDANCTDCPMQANAKALAAAPPLPAAESNLSQYEARAKMLVRSR